MTTPARPRLRSPASWLIVAVFIAEFFLFDHFGSRRITSIYPRWNDQIQYLSECYTGYEYAREHGVAAGLWHMLVNPSAQGTLHDAAALIEFEFVGPSRSAALALNMLALIAWQAVLFFAVGRRTASTSLAWLAAMLPLALRGPWQNEPGSAYDFRLDHLAMCAIGATAGLALLTERFRRRGWSAVFGAATGITLLTRFITGTYFVVIDVALFLWLACIRSPAGAPSRLAAGPRPGRQPPGATAAEAPSAPGVTTRRSVRSHALTNLVIAAVTAIAIALPIFWLNREWVWNYYYIGHYVGPESAIRNQNFGVMRSLEYVFGFLGRRHLGAFFGWFFVAATAALIVARGSFRRRDHAADNLPANPHDAPGDLAVSSRPRVSFATDALVVGTIFILGPALVLTLHPQKSDVVLGALAPGVILIVVSLWTWLAGEEPASNPVAHASGPRLVRDSAGAIRPSARMSRSGGLPAIAFVAAITALACFARRQTMPVETPAAMKGFREVNTLADLILTQADAAKLPVIHVSVDYITDALDAQVLRVVCYERHHVWKDWDMKLPTGIAEPDAATVRQRVAESDFVFLTDDNSTYAGYPYDKKLAAMRPELRAWCDAHLVVLRRFAFNGHPVTLYKRPALGAAKGVTE